MIDFDKPLQTVSGREVRIYATDGAGEFSVHGAYLKGEWDSVTWTKDGRFEGVKESCLDLVNVKTKRTGWVNVFKTSEDVSWCGNIHPSKEEAERVAEEAVATIKIEWEE